MIRGHHRIRRFSKKMTLEQQPKRIKEKMMSIPKEVCSKQKNKDPEAWCAWHAEGPRKRISSWSDKTGQRGAGSNHVVSFQAI